MADEIVLCLMTYFPSIHHSPHLNEIFFFALSPCLLNFSIGNRTYEFQTNNEKCQQMNKIVALNVVSTEYTLW